MERTRLVAGVLLVLLIAAALIFVVVSQARDVEQPTTAAEPTASAEAPSPDPEGSPQATPERQAEPVAVPTPDTTGRDFDHIFREINEFRDWLLANPNPDLVRLVYHPDCDCHTEMERRLSRFIEASARLVGDPSQVLSVQVVEEFESLVHLSVDVRTPERELVSEGGTPIDVASEQQEEYEIILVRPTTRWVVREVRAG